MAIELSQTRPPATGIGASPLAVVFGGTGFIGRHVVARLAQAGWRVRVGTRNSDLGGFVRMYGDVGQVEPVATDVRDDASVRFALQGADAAINLVGILYQSSGAKFTSIHSDGAERIARLSIEAEVPRLIHVSAIGADPESPSRYAASKGMGEQLVRTAQPDAVVLRPSVVFGEGDQFFNRFARMAELFPMLPIVGAETKFQPVHVDDVARAIQAVLAAPTATGVFELGGPTVYTFRELMQVMLAEIRRSRLILPVPFAFARPLGAVLGLFPNPQLTLDQVTLLEQDNVVANEANTLEDLGIAPTPVESVIGTYLGCYRPGGQYSDLMTKAKA